MFGAVNSLVWLMNGTKYKARTKKVEICIYIIEEPFSRGSSQPRDQTQVSWITDGFFTSWTTRDPQEYWSGWPIPSPADLPDAEIKPQSPALQADSLPTELSGKLYWETEEVIWAEVWGDETGLQQTHQKIVFPMDWVVRV